MRVLLTGANGFVGQHLGAHLVQQGHQVVAATRRDHGKLNYTPVRRVVVGKIDPATDWSAALEGVEVIIHLAARVHVMKDQTADPLSAFREVNTAGTLRLARQAADAGIKRFVYLSTIKVNGEQTTDHAFCETDPAAPMDPYALSKWEAEQQLLALAANTGLEVSIVRPPLVYGPQVRGNFLRLLGFVARAWPLPLASIRNRRSLVGIRNLCGLLEVCMQHPAAAGEVFLVADEQDLSTPELLRLLAAAMGRPCRLVPFPTALLASLSKLLGQQAIWARLAGSLQVDISKARHTLGWQPAIPVEQGMAETVAWYQKTNQAKQ